MFSSAVPLAAFALLLAAVSTPAPLPEQPPSRVKVMFDQMRNGKYQQEAFNFPKLEWSDIPALLDRAESTTELKTFPTNPISSFHIPTRPEGVVALWLVEGVRKGGKYPSLNPRIHPAGDTAEERATNHKALAAAYKGWWAKVKQLPPEKARDVNPLEGTKLLWQ